VDNLVDLAVANRFAGINLDLEAVRAADKTLFSTFVGELAVALHNRGLRLIASVPAKVSDAAPVDFRGYDYAALGVSVDFLQVMTYDEVGPGWAATGFNGNVWPGPESGLDWQNAVLTYAVTRVPAAKVLSGLPSYGYDFSTGKVVYWSGYSGVIASHRGAQLSRDAVSATPYASWGLVKPQADGVAWSSKTRQPALWYDDALSLQTKAQRVTAYNLGGTSVWAMGYEDAAFWTAVNTGLGRKVIPKN
jgi:spore germination protein YaaH